MNRRGFLALLASGLGVAAVVEAAGNAGGLHPAPPPDSGHVDNTLYHRIVGDRTTMQLETGVVQYFDGGMIWLGPGVHSIEDVRGYLREAERRLTRRVR